MLNAEIETRRQAAMSRGVGVMTQIYVDKAENAELWDKEGNRYIDFAAGIAVVNTGHRHPKVIAAVKDQLDHFTHTCHQVVPYENYVRLAERLSAIAPIKGEWVMLKKRASSFSGTPLAGYLRSCGVDTILVTGVTATACVRTTICDGIQDGFRTIAVRECIGDRVPGAVAWNLYDIDAKFADVETVDTCVNYLNNVEGWNNEQPA